MKRLVIAIFMCLTGCASVPELRTASSDSRAISILRASAEAQGYSALLQLHDVHAEFDGKFSDIVPKVQPVLVDQAFRGSSEEDYFIHENVVTQTHHGVGGTKTVLRKAGAVTVTYNGKTNEDTDVKAAAALVADDYRMFLLGPAFFLERGGVIQYLGTESVDGFDCDQLLVELKPGLGNSPLDRAVISVDRTEHFVRRLRITVEGMESTKGAVADIFLRDQIRVNGIVFPTRFYEELKNPFDAPVHNWRLTGISLHSQGH
jgi:hypothetical protein